MTNISKKDDLDLANLLIASKAFAKLIADLER